MSFIALDRVSLRYARGEAPVLEDVSLAIERGEVIAIVGPSGCGKSSLLKLLSGLRLPDAGALRVEGEPVRGALDFVGMAFQNATLLPWRSTLDNVLLPLEVSPRHRASFRRRRHEHVAAAEQLLATVGLDGYAGHSPHELSGGMQQRASLCRALIHEPALLLLDEPFAALDAFTREELWGVLQALWTQRHFTAVLVTHDLREAVYLADRVHVMQQRPGRIVETCAVELPRPRTLEATFEPAFVDLVHRLRNCIGEVRAAA